MLFLLTVLTVAYFAFVIWVRRSLRRPAELAVPVPLPEPDRPPPAAVGWPPEGTRFTMYVDEGFAALDAYLEEGSAA